MQFTDRLTIDRSHRTKDGYLRVVAKGARVGIQQYRGLEVDPGGEHFAKDDVVNVYRPPSEVFDDKSLSSFVGRPITDDHPSVAVTAKNWRDHSRGVVGGAKAYEDEGWIRFDMALMDAELIEKVDAGKRELSCGYACTLDVEDGTAPDGTAYQAIQRSIRGNHVAVVDRARAGGDARIHDGGNKLFECCDAATIIFNPVDDQEIDPMTMHTLTIDGLKVPNVSDEAKAAIEKLQGQITTATAAKDAAETALTDAKSEHDKALGAKDAEIEKLKGQIVDETKIDELADAKAEVVGKAKTVLGDKLPETKGKTVAEVRRAAVAAQFGDEAVADKSDDYVEARFDAMTADAKAEDGKPAPFKAPIVATNDGEVADAYTAMVNDLQDASKPKQAKAA